MIQNARESVSVIIPVFNRSRYLKEAINSVLGQDPRPEELIIVDDGSTDDTKEAAYGFVPPARYIHQNHAGAAAARNNGIRASRGSLIAFLDSDDVWTAGKMHVQKRLLEEHPELDMVAGMVESFFSTDISEIFKQNIRMPGGALSGLVPSAVVIRRRLFDRVGLFPLDTEIGEFIAWFLKARELGCRYVVAPEVVAKRRVHDHNLGIEKSYAKNDYLRIIKAAMERRRKDE